MVQIRKDFSKPASSHSLNWAILKQKKPNGQGKKAAEPPAFFSAARCTGTVRQWGKQFSHVYLWHLWGREFECIKTAAHIPHPLRRFAVVLPEPQDFRRCKAHIFNKINKRLICLALFDNGWSFLIQSFDHPVRRATWMFLHQETWWTSELGHGQFVAKHDHRVVVCPGPGSSDGKEHIEADCVDIFNTN